MFLTQFFNKDSQPLDDREVLSKDLAHLANQMAIRLTLIGTPKQELEQILIALTSHNDKSSFYNQTQSILVKSEVTVSKANEIQHELEWLLRKDNFRWSFKAFHLHNLKILGISEDNIEFS